MARMREVAGKGGYARASLARLAGVLAALGVAYRAPLTLEVGRAHHG
jgi:hypothetical protein